MRTLQTILFPSFITLIGLTSVACGGADELPAGSLQESLAITQTEVTLDGEVKGIGASSTFLTRTESGLELRWQGVHDPQPNIADEEIYVHAVFELDEAALRVLPLPITIDFDGSSVIRMREARYEFEPGHNNASSLLRAKVELLCYCRPPEVATQQLRGTIQIDRLDDLEISGSLSVDAEGQIPTFSDEHVAEVRTPFSSSAS